MQWKIGEKRKEDNVNKNSLKKNFKIKLIDMYIIFL